MEMKDLSYTYEAPSVAKETSAKNEKHYPTLRLEKSIPMELMSKDVGDECEVKLVARISAKSINEDMGKKRMSVTLECLKMGYEKSTKTKKKDVNNNAQSYME